MHLGRAPSSALGAVHEVLGSSSTVLPSPLPLHPLSSLTIGLGLWQEARRAASKGQGGKGGAGGIGGKRLVMATVGPVSSVAGSRQHPLFQLLICIAHFC